MKDWTPGKVIGALITAGAAAGIMFWGVPYYLDSEVSVRVKAELNALPPASVPQAVVDNTAAINSLNTTMQSMETRMIERDRLFMEYLQKQAERGN